MWVGVGENRQIDRLGSCWQWNVDPCRRSVLISEREKKRVKREKKTVLYERQSLQGKKDQKRQKDRSERRSKEERRRQERERNERTNERTNGAKREKARESAGKRSDFSWRACWRGLSLWASCVWVPGTTAWRRNYTNVRETRARLVRLSLVLKSFNENQPLSLGQGP